MLKIDTSGPLRSHTQLRALVEAVHAAGEHDELDWIEWKSFLDLSDHVQRGVVAFHILGMANRDPGVASRVVGGCGYIVVGVEPGKCAGIATVDPADLEPQIQRFLGQEAPTWQPMWIEREGAYVLVVIVDPPRQGDPIWTLASDFNSYRSGAVLVRRQGATHQANQGEIRRLTTRAQPRTGGPRLSVDLQGEAASILICPIDLDPEAFSRWLDAERARLLRPLEAQDEGADADAEGASSVKSSTTDPDRRQLVAGSDVARAMSEMARIADTVRSASRALGQVRKEEDRSPEAYREQVDAYLARAEEVLAAVAVDQHIRNGGCTVRLAAMNPTDWPFREVEFELRIPGEGVAALDDEFGVRLPGPPRIWGDYWINPIDHFHALGDGLEIARPMFAEPYIGDIGPSLQIDNSGSARLTFPPVDLAPGATSPLDEFHLLLPGRLAGAIHTATWTARSIHVPGIDDGTLEFRVADASVAASDLLTRAGDG